MKLPPDHPQRRALNDEVHARPPEALIGPLRLSYLVLMSADRAAESTSLSLLLARYSVAPLQPEQNHFSADLGPFRLRFERHTEFVRYTFIVSGTESKPFAEPAILSVPAEWVAALPGEIVVATHAVFLPRAKPDPRYDAIANACFSGNPLVGSHLAHGAATVFTDFRIHGDGFGRLLIHDHALKLRQAGRHVQRLLEIDTYRVMALLALPVARALAPFLNAAESELVDIANRLSSAREEDEPKLLDQLTRLEAEIERRHTDTLYRFSAANAYYDLVEQRIRELREERIEGLQTFREFNDRRLAPAMATCRSVSGRQGALSERVAHATALLNTRVDVTREKQNQALLQSMDRRANLQLRLQQTVEGLSVAAITYYIVGLAGYAAKAAKAAGWDIDPEIAVGVAIPIVAVLVWLGLLRFRKSLHRETDGSGPLRKPD